MVISKTAPVWIGEGGASLDGTDGQSADDLAWATAIAQYVNGQAPGGPTFAAGEQPMGFDWWYFGYGPGQQMDGIYVDPALTQYNQAQKIYGRRCCTFRARRRRRRRIRFRR